MAEKTVSQVQQDASQSQQNNAQAQASTAQAAPQPAHVAAAFQDAWTRAISSGTAAMAPFTAPFQKAMDDQVARVSGMQAEYLRAESQGVEQMLAGVDEMTRLTKAGVQWYVTMATQGRQMTMDAARRSASSFTPAV